MTTDLPRGQATRRLLAPLPAAVFAVLLGLSWSTPAQAATEEPAQPELSLVAGTRGVVHRGSTLNATLTIENPGTQALDASSAVLRLGDEPFETRAALRAWMQGTVGDQPLTTIGAEPADEIAAGDSDTVIVSVPSDDEALQDLAPGVYPLLAEYGEASAQSVVVVSEESEAVGLVMPITAPVSGSGLLSADQLASLTAPEGALTAQLDAASASPAILAVDPAIPAAIRVLGDDAPLSAVEWLEELMLLPNDRFALQFGDADVATQLQAGLKKPLQPLSLEGYATAPEPEPTPTPTPTESPASVDDEDALDLERLLSIGDATASLYWPAPGDASAAVIDGLRAADDAAVVLTPSDATEEGRTGSGVPASGATAGGGAALVYDTAASAALDAVANAETETETDEAAATASAELWFAGHDAGDEPVLVALSRGVATPPFVGEDGSTDTPPADLAQRLGDAVDVVARGSAVEPQRLEELLAAKPRTVTPLEVTPDEDRVDFVSDITRGEERVAVTATALETPELLTGTVRAEALQTLGVGWKAQPASWRAAASGFRANTDARANAIAIQDPAPVNLLSTGASLPVWVRNDLPWPVHLTLLARPSDPRLDIADATEITAQQRSASAVQVPVEARVGSGNVRIELTLLSPAGKTIGPLQTVQVAVRAEWETIGIVVLGVLIVGLLGTGIVRTILRRRRTPTDPDPDPDRATAADGSAKKSDHEAPTAASPGDTASPDATTEENTHG